MQVNNPDKHPSDTGCEISARCQDCPLTTDRGKYLCLDDIANGTRALLQQHSAILSAYKDYNKGITTETIARGLGVSKFTVRHWINKKRHINRVFKKFAKAIPYLPPYVSPHARLLDVTVPNHS